MFSQADRVHLPPQADRVHLPHIVFICSSHHSQPLFVCIHHVVCYAALPIYNASALEESNKKKVEHRPNGSGCVKARETIARRCSLGAHAGV